MVNTYQTSKITTGSRTKSGKSRFFSQCIYEVTVNGEDGEFFNCEVMADTSAGACAVAEDLARDVLMNITYIEVRCLG
ncbi:MAG: hypothetical protein IKP16_08095 [Prevotella sp.]|nr:hypothetical protein [Prevotella sp.]